jgi:glycosyltransferase involved in cell wall biosynthesis
MTDEPLVAVVIPSFNYGKFVVGAVESALAQTYRRREVVVVDDGSTDDTRDRLAPYQDRIRYIYQSNQGLHGARNTALRAGTGDLVAFLDSDDLWHPRKLELQVRFLAAHPEAGLVAADAVADLSAGWPEVKASEMAATAYTLRDLVLCSRFGVSSVLVRRSCLDRVGLFEAGLRGVEDRDLWLRIAEHFPVFKLHQPLWWYREHGESISFDVALMEASELKVLHKAFANLDSLRGRPLLKRKALSRALVANAHMYDLTGMRLRAVSRILRSFVLWPWPFHRGEAKTSFVRLKMLVLILGRLVRRKPAAYRARGTGEKGDG